jgi:Flp pilus assembly protein CpaB
MQKHWPRLALFLLMLVLFSLAISHQPRVPADREVRIPYTMRVTCDCNGGFLLPDSLIDVYALRPEIQDYQLVLKGVRVLKVNHRLRSIQVHETLESVPILGEISRKLLDPWHIDLTVEITPSEIRQVKAARAKSTLYPVLVPDEDVQMDK